MSVSCSICNSHHSHVPEMHYAKYEQQICELQDTIVNLINMIPTGIRYTDDFKNFVEKYNVEKES